MLQLESVSSLNGFQSQHQNRNSKNSSGNSIHNIYTINRRRPIWDTVLQPENDLFDPEIQLNLPQSCWQIRGINF